MGHQRGPRARAVRRSSARSCSRSCKPWRRRPRRPRARARARPRFNHSLSVPRSLIIDCEQCLSRSHEQIVTRSSRAGAFTVCVSLLLLALRPRAPGPPGERATPIPHDTRISRTNPTFCSADVTPSMQKASVNVRTSDLESHGPDPTAHLAGSGSWSLSRVIFGTSLTHPPTLVGRLCAVR